MALSNLRTVPCRVFEATCAVTLSATGRCCKTSLTLYKGQLPETLLHGSLSAAGMHWATAWRRTPPPRLSIFHGFATPTATTLIPSSGSLQDQASASPPMPPAALPTFSPGFLHGGHVHGGHVTHNPPFATGCYKASAFSEISKPKVD